MTLIHDNSKTSGSGKKVMIGLQISSAGDKNSLYDRYEHNFDDELTIYDNDFGL